MHALDDAMQPPSPPLAPALPAPPMPHIRVGPPRTGGLRKGFILAGRRRDKFASLGELAGADRIVEVHAVGATSISRLTSRGPASLWLATHQALQGKRRQPPSSGLV